DVTGLGQRGRVGDRERDIEQPREGLREQRLARPGRPEQQDVRLGELDAVLAGPVAARLDALVVVVDRDRQALLGLLLADHVGIEELVDLAGLRQAVPFELAGLGPRFPVELLAEIDALIADICAWASYELLDLLLALAAERALQQVPAVAHACHPDTPLPWGRHRRPPSQPAAGVLPSLSAVDLDRTASAPVVVAY